MDRRRLLAVDPDVGGSEEVSEGLDSKHDARDRAGWAQRRRTLALRVFELSDRTGWRCSAHLVGPVACAAAARQRRERPGSLEARNLRKPGSVTPRRNPCLAGAEELDSVPRSPEVASEFMLTKVLIGVLGIAAVVPIAWQQSSPQGAVFKFQFPLAVAPTANGTWTWSGDQQAFNGGTAAIAVTPNQPGRFTTITDVNIWAWSNSSYAHALWWIKDGTTGAILWSGALTPCHGPNLSAGRDSVHLSTPIVLDHSSSAPPTIEFGAAIGVPMSAIQGFQCACSVAGRYTDFQ